MRSERRSGGTVEISRGETIYRGTYQVSNDRDPVVEVRSLDFPHRRPQRTQLGDSNVERLARVLLNRMVPATPETQQRVS